MDNINWSDRLIGIEGSRGVGKTTFLLQYAKDHFGVLDRKCLYVNMNNFYFQGQSLSSFAEDFYRQGGRTLLVDQVFKDPNWSHELRLCYDNIPGLQIVFTGSSVMNLNDDNPELQGIVSSYTLRGLSFREYLNLQEGIGQQPVTLEEILNNYARIAAAVTKRCDPLKLFEDYLHRGYYPFLLDKPDHSEYLLKIMNMMIEVDILMVKQIELKYLSRIKKLLYLLALEGNTIPNISQLAKEIGTSRTTVMNYIKYLSNARLINVQYRPGASDTRKPMRIMMHNPNLMYAILPYKVNEQELFECFFLNALRPSHEVSIGDRLCSFLVDGKYRFRIVEEMPKRKSSKVYYLMHGMSRLRDDQIPLWIFGLLY